MMTPRTAALSLTVFSLLIANVAAAPQGDNDKITTSKKKAAERDAIAKSIRTIEHQISIGKLQDKLDRMKEASKATAADLAYKKALRAERAAKDALTNFEKHEAPTELESTQISLQGAKDSATHAADEFKELVAMYKADEFAEMTKELVLKRGRSRKALADRRLKVQESKLANLKGHTHPAKLRDLRGKLGDAEAATIAARRAQAQTELEIQIAREKAKFKNAELRRDLTAAKKKQGES